MESGKIEDGGMAEWLKAAVLKTVSGVTRSGVRIPLPPPSKSRHHNFHKKFTLMSSLRLRKPPVCASMDHDRNSCDRSSPAGRSIARPGAATIRLGAERLAERLH